MILVELWVSSFENHTRNKKAKTKEAFVTVCHHSAKKGRAKKKAGSAGGKTCVVVSSHLSYAIQILLLAETYAPIFTMIIEQVSVFEFSY